MGHGDQKYPRVGFYINWVIETETCKGTRGIENVSWIVDFTLIQAISGIVELKKSTVDSIKTEKVTNFYYLSLFKYTTFQCNSFKFVCIAILKPKRFRQ